MGGGKSIASYPRAYGRTVTVQDAGKSDISGDTAQLEADISYIT